MEATREGEIEELKRLVLIREKDAAEAFEKLSEFLIKKNYIIKNKNNQKT